MSDSSPSDASTTPVAGEAGGGSSDGAVEGSLPEGSTGSPEAGVPCGPQATCSGNTPVCCLGTTPACAHQNCGCTTQLACASDLDCQLPAGVCCIDNVKDSTCSSGHFSAACAVACSGGQSHLCDPASPTLQCLAGKQCSTNSGDLQNVGLPPGSLYGVCQ